MKKAIRSLYGEFMKLKCADLYKVELMRLIWSQIRFIYIQHNITYDDIHNKCKCNAEEQDELWQLMKELYPGFIYPDSCNIEITNNHYLDKAISKLLISPKDISYVEDKADCRERICISYEDMHKEFVVDSTRYMNGEYETILWNLADDIFRNIWG